MFAQFFVLFIEIYQQHSRFTPICSGYYPLWKSEFESTWLLMNVNGYDHHQKKNHKSQSLNYKTKYVITNFNRKIKFVGQERVDE